MRKKDVKKYTLMAIIVFLLTGCGAKLPDMTGEEEQIVSEYAAKLLLKYDANNRSRLVSREEVAEWEQKEQEKAESQIPESTQEGMDPIDDTPVIEIGQEALGEGATVSIEEFYGLEDGLRITYQGSETYNSYSQSGTVNEYFSLDAASGNKLLVLKFCIENQTETEQKIDLLSQGANIRLNVNGNDGYSIFMTMLMNDMSTYVGNIAAGENVDVVLLAEVEEEVVDNISSMTLKLKSDSKICTIQLR